MATSKEFLEYILDKISTLEQITYRQMMGEYIVYYKGKIAAYLCDNRLLVKILPVTEKMLPNARREPPYDGAKDMLLVEDIDDGDFWAKLFEAMYDELPAQKIKKGNRM